MATTQTETVLPVPPEEAWEAITNPDQLQEWLGDEVEIELEPGGDIAVRSGDDRREGFVEEVSEPWRLVFWWSTEADEASRVEIEIEPEDGGTRIRVVESRPLESLHDFAAPQMLTCA